MPIEEEDRLTHRARAMQVCGECGELSGPVETSDGVLRDQACSCDGRSVERLWPRYDYNHAIELCHACAAQPVRCGSRLSLFYCHECQWRVDVYNARTKTSAAPRSYIPIGRHSMLHDIMYWTFPGAAGASQAPPEYTARFEDLVSRIRLVTHWRRERIAAVVRAGGDHRLPGDVYLARARELYEPEEAVAKLAARLEELGPPPYPVRIPRSGAVPPMAGGGARLSTRTRGR